jgi:opacity protein-like surface antigen
MLHLFAQSTANDSPLKISGFIQVEAKFRETEKDGYEPAFGVRRGFLKSTYTNEWGQAVLQINATEKGVGIKDAYIKIQPPGVAWINLTAGLYLRPFGYEVSYSASARETPERVRVVTSIFPDERDLGAILTLLAPKNTAINGLKLEFGIVNGNGMASEDKAKYGNLHKDFIGRLSYSKSYSRVNFGIGTSVYSGKVTLFGSGDPDRPYRAYEMNNGDFRETNKQGGDMINRSVYGFEGQFTGKTTAGNTTIRAEYLFGTQPGLINTNVSNCAAGYLNGSPGNVYVRPFSGAYVYFIQDIFSPKHSAVFRFDYYDPNTKISGDNLKTDGDVKYTTVGAGYMFNPSSNVRIAALYEWITNETSNSATVHDKFQKDIKDNLFTLRLQYKF